MEMLNCNLTIVQIICVFDIIILVLGIIPCTPFNCTASYQRIANMQVIRHCHTATQRQLPATVSTGMGTRITKLEITPILYRKVAVATAW